MNQSIHIETKRLAIGYDGRAIMSGIELDIRKGEIFFIMGGSGSGKSTLLKTLIGLLPPVSGEIRYDGKPFLEEDPGGQEAVLRNTGVLYQGGALFSSLTLLENVALPLRIHTKLADKDILELSRYKLSLVSLSGSEDKYPHEISGGMMKRAGLARALALDPDLLFFDEPSAGLDPITSSQLDETILEINRSLGPTIVIVSHELPSIFALADRAVFLNASTRKQLEIGDPNAMQTHSIHSEVRTFLNRGETTDKPEPI